MTSDAERYRQAARRASTQRRYARVVEHFEAEWGGRLPASSDMVVRYLAAQAEQFSASTLRVHLAALAQWHLVHGFVDPTKAEQVRDVVRGIQALHPRPVKQAAALPVQALAACIGALEVATLSTDAGTRLRAQRDRALILVGFWRAFRSEDLCRLRIEHIVVHSGEGLELFLPSGKTDRDNLGRTFTVPALKRLCPVQAYEQWLEASGLQEGPVFRAIDRWGHLGRAGLNSSSVSDVLRQAFSRHGLDANYSGHSLRRGFATWASDQHWSTKALMDYVGWRDVHSALRYVDANAPFGEWQR